MASKITDIEIGAWILNGGFEPVRGALTRWLDMSETERIRCTAEAARAAERERWTAEVRDLRDQLSSPKYMVVGSQQHVRVAEDRVVHMLVYAIDDTMLGPKSDGAALLKAAEESGAQRERERCARICDVRAVEFSLNPKAADMAKDIGEQIRSGADPGEPRWDLRGLVTDRPPIADEIDRAAEIAAKRVKAGRGWGRDGGR